MRRPLSFALIGLLSYSACVLAAEPVAGPQISLSAQARQTVANDQALAVLYAEASSANPQQVVDELNRQGQRALAIAKGYRQIRIASGNRNNQMLKYALALVDNGMSLMDVTKQVHAFNDKLNTPLPKDEIESTILVTVAKKYAKV